MFGKFIGGLIGFYFLGFVGAIIGSLVGHFFFDVGSRRRRGNSEQGGGFFGGGHHGFAFGGARMHMYRQIQEMYFKLFFSMLGKMAKADGVISKAEGDYFIGVTNSMNLDGDAKARAIQYFNEAKRSSHSIHNMAQQFAHLCNAQPQLMRQMMYQLVGIASADGIISREEEQILREVANIFSISPEEVEHLFKSEGASTEASYHILGVSKDASVEEIQKAYRTLLKEYHPDILRSKGLPQELMKDAGKRFLNIQQAWEAIKKEKGITG